MKKKGGTNRRRTEWNKKKDRTKTERKKMRNKQNRSSRHGDRELTSLSRRTFSLSLSLHDSDREGRPNLCSLSCRSQPCFPSFLSTHSLTHSHSHTSSTRIHGEGRSDLVLSLAGSSQSCFPSCLSNQSINHSVIRCRTHTSSTRIQGEGRPDSGAAASSHQSWSAEGKDNFLFSVPVSQPSIHHFPLSAHTKKCSMRMLNMRVDDLHPFPLWLCLFCPCSSYLFHFCLTFLLFLC